MVQPLTPHARSSQPINSSAGIPTPPVPPSHASTPTPCSSNASPLCPPPLPPLPAPAPGVPANSQPNDGRPHPQDCNDAIPPVTDNALSASVDPQPNDRLPRSQGGNDATPPVTDNVPNAPTEPQANDRLLQSNNRTPPLVTDGVARSPSGSLLRSDPGVRSSNPSAETPSDHNSPAVNRRTPNPQPPSMEGLTQPTPLGLVELDQSCIADLPQSAHNDYKAILSQEEWGIVWTNIVVLFSTFELKHVRALSPH